MKSLLFVLCSSVIFAAPLSAQTIYYVDATGGSDANDGLAPTDEGGGVGPWQTLTNIATPVSGDSFLLKRGEVWQTTSTRTLEGGVTYADYGTGDRPIVEGAGRVTGWTLDSGSRYFATTVLTDNSTFMVWEDGVRGNRETALVDVDVATDFFLDDPADRIYYIASDSADPDTHVMNVSRSHIPFIVEGASSDGVIRNWDFRYGSGTLLVLNEFSGTEGLTATTGWVIDGCRFTGGNQHGVQVFGGGEGSEWVIRNSRFDHNVLEGAVLPRVQNTTLTGVTADMNDRVGIGLTAEIANSNNVISDCTVFDNGQDGIAISPGAPGDGVVVEKCLIYQNGRLAEDRSGISTGASGVIFRFNRIHSNNLLFAIGHGIQIDLESTNVEAYGNVIWNNANAGIAMGGDTGNKAYNNTLYANLSRTGAGAIDVYTAANDDVEIRNNLIVGHTKHIHVVPGVTGATIDDNLYDDDAGTKFHFEGTLYNFADWKTNSSFDANSLGPVDPLLVDLDNDDFTLRSGSPAIDAGGDLGASFADALLPGSGWPSSVFVGDQNDNGPRWEIGAYVFVHLYRGDVRVVP